ncbi:DUF4405 domain-containing protein [[Clostridium] hylemonae]|uniref:Flavinylation-associated cytochrome domain-containing protein n=1 Tax=[Clostridium] hylemonae DSM 15053 TaxID=553973 RepID=C0BXI2_9FIRM|nr:DUF4405 domain-containing protein [[Clostridium] hylemonae]EEG75289.1 hypothetical protein CLOHYLEM_04519 [[Clostridium] hylemonae DSM 15053]QEK17008.1 hypothetical protein LAJLEIBI_01017 [[Clostridium] hylemonae DSM 15053]
MTGKRKFQIFVDFAMAALLPVLMAYSLLGEAVHEWVGVAMFSLFLFHNALNWKWYKNLFGGRHSSVRLLGTAVNILILLLMLSLMASGIVMSRYAFQFLAIEGGASLARTVHLAASYWCYVLTSVHLGLHGGMFLGMLRKAFHMEKASQKRRVVLRIVAVLLSAYGIYAFIQRGLIGYMLLQIQFVFFDFSEPLVFFFLDYLAVMALFTLLGYYAAKLLAKVKSNPKKP